jgi:hypothetical protein
MDITDVRRANLRILIGQAGGVSRLSRLMGYANPSFLSQMAGPSPSREITEKSARKIEEALKLPSGFLDKPGVKVSPRESLLAGVTSPAERAESPASAGGPVDASLIAEVIRMVHAACHDLGVSPDPAKLGDVVALAYMDGVEHGGHPREDRVRQLARLAG